MIDFSQDRPPVTSDERMKALRSIARIERELDYVDTRVADTELPPPRFDGESYQADVPDTLDLTDNARLAINAFTRMLDPAMDYRFFGNANFVCKPAKLMLSASFECTSKHLESLPLMRLMSGCAFNCDIDNKFMRSRLHLTAKDGFFYSPWSKASWINGHLGGAPPGEDIVTRTRQPFESIWEEGRMILALCMWHQLDGNPLWLELIEKKIDRLTELAMWEGDACHFGRRFYVIGDRGSVPGPGGVKPDGQWSLFDLMFGAVGSALYYRLSDHAPALKLARGLALRALNNPAAFSSSGRWLTNHFHTNTAALISLMNIAEATNDGEMMEFVRREYEFGKALGEPLLGYYPEHVTGADYSDYDVQKWGIHKTCETCETADMLVLAVKLSRAGVGNYWEDVERLVRNQFVANQIRDTDWVERIPTDTKWGDDGPQQLWEDETDAVERTVGSWAGWALPNDARHFGLMQCCLGNAGRSLYYAWDSIVTRNGDGVQVNLLLNRASRWVDVDSHLPYEGKVVLKIKDAPRLAVRIPAWTDRGAVTCAVNGAARAVTSSNGRIRIDELRAGDQVTVEFPMRDFTAFREIGEGAYALRMKGDTVIDIDPRGTIYPLYERSHYAVDRAPIKRVIRFVPKNILIW